MSRVADPNAKISLLKAAEEVFAEHGVDAAKVEEITRRAGLSKGAFYLHFTSKEEALKQVAESFLARFSRFCVPPTTLATLPETPEGIIDFWFEQDIQMFEYLWQNRTIIGILSLCAGEYAYLAESFQQTVLRACRDWFELLKSKGLVRPELDADVVALLMWGAYSSLSHQMVKSARKPPFHEWSRQTVCIFMRGFGTPKFLAALERSACRQPTASQCDPRVSERHEPVVRIAKPRARVRV